MTERVNGELKVIQRLINLAKEDDNGCWIWQGSCKVRDYGSFSVDGKHELAHRVSYLLFKGVIPEGMSVRHTCDVPLCINPTHLEIGTHKDNMLDRSIRGRHGMAKLTVEEVTVIKHDLALEISCSQLAEAYGVGRTTISDIKHGRTWVHV